jgi:hypothetical protein
MTNTFKYQPAHTSKEAEDFKELKEILNNRGFLINEETKRWEYLFNALAAKITLSDIGEIEGLN